MLGMSMRMCCTVRQEQHNNFNSSVFTEASELLEEPEYELAIRAMACYSRHFSTYQSTMDFLLGEMFPSWKKKILAYYKGEGPDINASKYVNDTWIEEMDEFFCNAIKFAYEHIYNRTCNTWGPFVVECKKTHDYPKISKLGISQK